MYDVASKRIVGDLPHQLHMRPLDLPDDAKCTNRCTLSKSTASAGLKRVRIYPHADGQPAHELVLDLSH